MSTLQPNLKVLTLEECGEIGLRAYKLRQEGKFAEADIVLNDMPIIAGMAQNLKDEMGIEALIATGMNLSEAVQEYGMEWLDG